MTRLQRNARAVSVEKFRNKKYSKFRLLCFRVNVKKKKKEDEKKNKQTNRPDFSAVASLMRGGYTWQHSPYASGVLFFSENHLACASTRSLV